MLFHQAQNAWGMDSRVARATPLDTRAARMTEEEAFQPSRKNLSPLLSPSRSRNRESSVVAVGLHTRAIPWRHLRAPAGAAAPQSRTLFRGEDCLSKASSAALTFGTVAKAPEGPRPGAPGFGSFCRNKRTSSCGGETPHSSPFPCCRAFLAYDRVFQSLTPSLP